MVERKKNTAQEAARLLIQRLDETRRRLGHETAPVRAEAMGEVVRQELGKAGGPDASAIMTAARTELMPAFTRSEGESVSHQEKPQPAQDIVRLAIREALEKEQETAPPPGIGESEESLYRMVQLMALHCLRTNQGAERIRGSVRAGARLKDTSPPGSRAMRRKLRDCLNNETASVESLRHALDQTLTFLVYVLPLAQTDAIPAGVRRLLEDINPATIEEEYTSQFIGISHADAWRALKRRYADLVAGADDAWQQFFGDVFRDKLSEYEKEPPGE